MAAQKQGLSWWAWVGLAIIVIVIIYFVVTRLA